MKRVVLTAGMIKQLRELTGAKMMDCKAALQDTEGDMEEARRRLQQRGQIGGRGERQ